MTEKIQFYCPDELYELNQVDIEDRFSFSIESIDYFEALKIFTVIFKNVKAKEYFINYLSSAMLLPPWICFPTKETVSIFFRQGIGQNYTEYWLRHVEKLGHQFKKEIIKKYPANEDWIAYLKIKKIKMFD